MTRWILVNTELFYIIGSAKKYYFVSKLIRVIDLLLLSSQESEKVFVTVLFPRAIQAIMLLT